MMVRALRSTAVLTVLAAVAACGESKPVATSAVASSGAASSGNANPASGGSAHARNGKRPPQARKRAKKAAPNLPALDKQEHAKTTTEDKSTGKAVDYPCGSVRVGDEDIALECVDPAPLSPANEESRVVVPYALMPPPVAALPTTVDHRADNMEAPARNQGSVGSCTAFATTSALDHDLALWTGKVDPLSVMQVWAEYHKPNITADYASIMGRAIARENDWTYDAATAHTWYPQGSPQCAKDPSACGKQPDQQKIADLQKKGVVLVTQVARLWTRPKTEPMWSLAKSLPVDLMRASIAAGHDLVIGVRLPGKGFKPVAAKDDTSGAMYFPDMGADFKPPEKGGGHMMSLTGYHVTADGSYFLLKNSWGPKWGESGYAWIHHTTLAKMIGSVYAVDAQPVEAAGLNRPRAANGHVDACGAGLVPDSVTAACHEACPDGSPTADGACAEAEGCDAGEINQTGECVLAAPKVSGTDPKTGVAFACAAGGCVYTLPKAFEGCADKCQKSCPAPDFRLAKGNVLTCVE